MKLYYLSGAAIPSKKASSVHVMKMCQAFAGAGRAVHLFATPGADAADPFRFYGVAPEFRLEFARPAALPIAGGPTYAWRVRKRVLDLGIPNLFYGRHTYSLAAVSGLGVPLILEAHQLPLGGLVARTQKWLFRRPDFRRLVVISEALRQDYLAFDRHLSADRVVVAHDGADPPANDPGGTTADVGPPWPGRSGALQVGYVGSLYRGRGLELIAELARRLPHVDFHIIGGRDHEITFWREQCGAANFFVHGFVQHGCLGTYYRKLDVVLAPYQRQANQAEGGATWRWMSPLKVFEYMAHAKPIVASDIPVLREVLHDGLTAVLVGPERTDEWEGAIVRLHDPEARRTLGTQAYIAFEQCYTWAQRARNVLSGLG